MVTIIITIIIIKQSSSSSSSSNAFEDGHQWDTFRFGGEAAAASGVLGASAKAPIHPASPAAKIAERRIRTLSHLRRILYLSERDFTH